MRNVIRFFFAVGVSYFVTAIAIYLTENGTMVAVAALAVFLMAGYLSGKVKAGNLSAGILGACAIVLLVLGFVGTGYALKHAEAHRKSMAEPSQ